MAKYFLFCIAVLAAVCNVSAQESTVQDAYPACPKQWPGYKRYCCEGEDGSTAIYEQYALEPTPVAYDYIAEGWKVERQINYPEGDYNPGTPRFIYDADHVCVLVEPGNGTEPYIECATPDDHIEGKTDSSQYWHHFSNQRNNNATCYGTLTEITNDDEATACGSEDEDEADATGAGDSEVVTYAVDDMLDPWMLAMYLLTAGAVITYPAWGLVKHSLGSTGSESKKAYDLEKGLGAGYLAVGTPAETGNPSLTRNSYLKSDAAVVKEDPADDIHQFGANDHFIGTILYLIVELVQVFNLAWLTIVIMDHYYIFPNKIVEPSVELLAFAITWSIVTVYSLVVVVLTDGLRNYYRVPGPIDSCHWIEVIKPEDEAYALADRTPVTDWVKKWENMFRISDKPQGYTEVFPVKKTKDGSRFFEFQCLRYIFSEKRQRFLPSTMDIGSTYSDLAGLIQGMSKEAAKERLEKCGPNSLDIKMPSVISSFVTEFITFFYVYQIMFYASFFYWDYWQVAGPMTVIILLSGLINMFTKRKMQKEIIDMARMEGKIIVKRSGSWVEKSLRDLVPGDVVKIQKDEILPCDLVLLKGDPVMDESMLTGESTPVQKFQIPAESEPNARYLPLGQSKKYSLFAGTRVMSSGAEQEEGSSSRKSAAEAQCVGLVYTTGVNTARGQLVQNILFPVKMRFKFDDHMKIIIVGLVVLAIVAICIALSMLLSNDKLTNKLSFFLYMINIVGDTIHPLLPVVVTVGQLRAAIRLKEKGISCINPPRIALGGKVRVFCFDKTGTLTKEGLDVSGCVPVPSNKSQTMTTQIEDISTLGKLLTYALATAHNVGNVQGTLVGNEVELKMFSASGWELYSISADRKSGKGRKVKEDSSSSGQKRLGVKNPTSGEHLEIVKRFEFDHARMTMSVLVKDEKGNAYVFCKGSYEKIEQIARQDELPDGFIEAGDSLARDGAYVLGVGMKELGKVNDSVLAELSLNRDEVETDIDLLGLLVFRNELKSDTREAIGKLKDGDVRPVMITGDNALCGCYIARESGMVSADSVVYLGDTELGKHKPIFWTNVDTGEPVKEAEVKEKLQNSPDKVELALTGKAFDKMVESNDIAPILLKTRIFARMTPDGKVKVVQLLMERGLCVGMCGDGGNDCGALRAAHVGVAFSQAEASVVSPFTSASRSVTSVVQLLCEGRCSAVTSFKAVAYILCFGQGMLLKKLLVDYRFNVFPPVWLSVITASIICPIFSYAVTLPGPLKHLSNRRPSFSFIGPSFLATLIGENVLTVLFIELMRIQLFNLAWFCRFDPTGLDAQKWFLMTASYEATYGALSGVFLTISLSWSLCIGSRFRQPVWYNLVLVGAWVGSTIFLAILLVFSPSSSFSDWFGLASSTNVMGLPMIPLPTNYCIYLVLSPVLMAAVRTLYGGVFVHGAVADMFRAKYHKELVAVKV